MVKPIARGFLVFLLFLLLSAGFAVLWLKRGERDMSWAKPWLINALNPTDAPYSIGFSKATMDWRHFSQLGHLHLRDLTITERDGKIFALLPDVQVTLDPLGFLPGHHSLNSIEINAPRIFLTRSADGTMRVGLAGADDTLPLNNLIGFFLVEGADSRAGITLPFRAFTITNALFALQDNAGTTILTSAPLTFHIGKAIHNNLNGVLDMPFVYKDEVGEVNATLATTFTDHERVINAQIDQFPTELVCLFATCPQDIDMHGRVSGKMQLSFNRDGVFDAADIDLHSKEAGFTAPSAFPEPLEIVNSDITASVTNGGSAAALSRGHIKFKDGELNVQGVALKSADGWHAKGTGKCPRLEITRLYKYWPLPLAKDSRSWVISKLKTGYGVDATISFDITPQELSAHRFNDHSLASTIRAENITVDYLPGFPEVKGMNGMVYFTGKTIHVDGTSGELLNGSKVIAAKLVLPDLDNSKMPMEATLTVSAPAADAATMLALKPFTFDDGWHLDAGKISGSVDATMKLGFNAFSGADSDDGQIHLDHVTYDINAALKDIAQPGLFNRDIRGLNGTLLASNSAVSFNGKLALTPQTGVALAVAEDAKGHTTADISGSVPRSDFAALGLPDRKQFGEGTLGLNASVSLENNAVQVRHATIDLTDLAMEIAELNWTKKRGEKGSLVASTTEGKHNYTFSLIARDLHIENGTFTTDDADNLVTLNLPKVVSDNNDFTLNYTTTADGFTVDLNGKRLDSSASYAKSDNSLLADFPTITLNVNLDEMVLEPSMPFRQLKGKLACTRARCESANLTAQLADGTLKAGISRVNNARQLLITASNAGDFIKALGISDRLHDGTLTLRGNYDDSKQPPMFSGKLFIRDYTLKNSEILGRILSVASITGLANALTGSGIAFDHLVADIYHSAGKVRVDNGRASGTSLGITVSGAVDTTTTNLDLKGTLAPAYMFNSIVTKIPIIGKLAGGKGEGLFAFNYAVSGKYSDPKVSVNPLSGLAPGFLRGLFGASDNGVKDEENAALPPAYPGDRPPEAKPKAPASPPIPPPALAE